MAGRARVTAADRRWLEVLETGSDLPPEPWLHAAAHFAARSKRADVAFAVQPLEDAFRECSHVEVLAGIAEALVHHGARWGPDGWLETYLGSELFREEIAEALERVAARSTKLDPIVTQLLEAGPDTAGALPRRTKTTLIAHWARRDPARLGVLLDRLEAGPEASWWVYAAAQALLECDRLSTPNLERLVQWWHDDPEDHWLAWLAGATERHCPARLSCLEPGLDHPHAEVRGCVVTVLTRQALRERTHDRVEAWITSPDEASRRGAFDALARAKLQPEVARWLWQGAIDPDAEVREVAVQALEAGLAQASSTAASAAPIHRLGPALSDPVTGPALIRLCAQLVELDPRAKRTLHVLLGSSPGLQSQDLDTLRALCREEMVRTPGGCDRCAHLADRRSWTDDDEADRALQGLGAVDRGSWHIPGRFIEDDEADTVDQGLWRCTGCQTFYLWGRTEEWDVCSRWVRIVTQRQRPGEAIKLCRGALRTELEQGLDEQVRAFERDLGHPRVERRVEAVWTLGRGWLAKKHQRQLERLLADEAPELRAVTLGVMAEASPKSAARMALLAAPLLDDDDERVRSLAVGLVASQASTTTDIPTLLALANAKDPKLRQQAFRGLAAAEHGQLEAVDCILAALDDPVSEVRTAATTAAVAAARQDPALIVPALAARMSAASGPGAGAAASALSSLVGAGIDLTVVTDTIIAAMDRSDTGFHAERAVVAMLRRGTLSTLPAEALPALGRSAMQGGNIAQQIIRHLKDHGRDLSALVPLIPGMVAARSCKYEATTLFEHLARQEVDVSEIVGPLQELLVEESPSSATDDIARGLTLHALALGDPDKVREFTSHPRACVAQPAIRLVLDEPHWLGTIFTAGWLVAAAGHRNKSVREDAEDGLQVLLKQQHFAAVGRALADTGAKLRERLSASMPAWTPFEVRNCPVCRRLPKRLTLDPVHGNKKLPGAAEKLEWVCDHPPNSVKRCRSCNAYFDYLYQELEYPEDLYGEDPYANAEESLVRLSPVEAYPLMRGALFGPRGRHPGLPAELSFLEAQIPDALGARLDELLHALCTQEIAHPREWCAGQIGLWGIHVDRAILVLRRRLTEEPDAGVRREIAKALERLR